MVALYVVEPQIKLERCGRCVVSSMGELHSPIRARHSLSQTAIARKPTGQNCGNMTAIVGHERRSSLPESQIFFCSSQEGPGVTGFVEGFLLVCPSLSIIHRRGK